MNRGTQINIVAPFSAVAEVVPLLEAGVDELYCGIVPEEWSERFRSRGVNRRIFGNLSRYDELEAAIGDAHRFGRRISLVLNAQHYSEDQIDALVGLAGRFGEMGGDAAIVGDIALLAELAARRVPVALHVSSLLSCRNAEAAALYRDLGAHRVVLPRDVTLPEIGTMAAQVPELDFEAFVLNDGCPFEEGSCHTIHLPARLGGPICIDDYAQDHARADGRTMSAADASALAVNDERYREWLWYRFSCGFAVNDEGYPFGPCGLCAFPQFARHGIRAVKIAGREGNLERKLKSVALVKAVRDRLDAETDEGTLQAFAQGLRNRPDLCRNGFMCYYREALSPADARDVAPLAGRTAADRPHEERP